MSRSPTGGTVGLPAPAPGGGGLVAARYLHGWGVPIRVILGSPAATFEGVPAQQLHSLQQAGVGVTSDLSSGQSDCFAFIIDALVGYGLRGPLFGPAATLAAFANGTGRPVLSLDVPCGLDATSGVVYLPAVRARATLTLALPKRGLLAPAAACRNVGVRRRLLPQPAPRPRVQRPAVGR